MKVNFVNGLYRTRCGSIIRFPFEDPRYCRGVLVEVSKTCRSRDARCRIGVDWEYQNNGEWSGMSGAKDFHLHLVEEILP